MISLPGSGQDVAAFLAGERGRTLSPQTLKLSGMTSNAALASGISRVWDEV